MEIRYKDWQDTVNDIIYYMKNSTLNNTQLIPSSNVSLTLENPTNLVKYVINDHNGFQNIGKMFGFEDVVLYHHEQIVSKYRSKKLLTEVNKTLEHVVVPKVMKEIASSDKSYKNQVFNPIESGIEDPNEDYLKIWVDSSYCSKSVPITITYWMTGNSEDATIHTDNYFCNHTVAVTCEFDSDYNFMEIKGYNIFD